MSGRREDKSPSKLLPNGVSLDAIDQHANAHRYDRLPIRGGRVRTLERLHEALVDNARLYEGSLQDQRDAVAGSLGAVKDYLILQGFAPATIDPVIRPIIALVERELNILDPLFTERPRKGRPKRSLESENRTGAIAAIAEFWLSGLKQDDRKQSLKLAELARRLSGGWFGNLTATKIKQAREIVSQEPKDHPAVTWAELYLSHLEFAADNFGHQGAIEIVVRNLNRTAPKI